MWSGWGRLRGGFPCAELGVQVDPRLPRVFLGVTFRVLGLSESWELVGFLVSVRPSWRNDMADILEPKCGHRKMPLKQETLTKNNGSPPNKKWFSPNKNGFPQKKMFSPNKKWFPPQKKGVHPTRHGSSQFWLHFLGLASHIFLRTLA